MQLHGRRAKKSWQVRTLFDFPPSDRDVERPLSPCPDEASSLPTPSNSEACSPHTPVNIASGEKAKAHDILAAIRVLKIVEQERRAATAEERQTLARFGGFGPVALSIFPDPVTGRFKDGSWQEIGEKLKSALTPEEYDSAKRTTFNAFYTSPAVIAAMHEAIARLGVPRSATVLEPGCGTGNFMSMAPTQMHFVGIELDSISGRIARALHPRHA